MKARSPRGTEAVIAGAKGRADDFHSRGPSHRVPRKPQTGIQSLTPREIETLRRLASGMTAGEIAGEWGISVTTVHQYRANLLRKLGARTLADLTREAIKDGVIVVEREKGTWKRSRDWV